MARKVRQMRGKGNHIGLVPVPSMAAPDLDTRIALIQALIPVALEKVHVELQADVERLAGERYVREGRRLGHVRWTAQRGSIYLADQKIPLAVPRVRDRLRNQEVPLPTYERLQAPRTLDAGLLHKVLGGLSTREYERCASPHWRQLRTNNPLEQIIREVRRRTRVVGAFPDGQSALMLVAARLHHIAATKWGTRRYLTTELLQTDGRSTAA